MQIVLLQGIVQEIHVSLYVVLISGLNAGWTKRFLKEVDDSYSGGAVIECTEVFWVYNILLNRIIERISE